MKLSTVEQIKKRKIPPRLPELVKREEKLECLNKLAGRLAHDFNNYLVPITGYLHLIQMEIPKSSSAHNHLKAIGKAAKRTEKDIESVFLATRPQRCFRPFSTEFDELLLSELERWQASISATAWIEVTHEIEPVVMPIDENLWKECIAQLLSNARYALAVGGQLFVSLKRVQISEQRALDLGIPGTDVVELIFQDTGFGISKENLERVFEPFFSTRPKQQGKGLGLTMVFGITRLHAGQVLLESTEDVGTTIKIILPVFDSATDAVKANGDLDLTSESSMAPIVPFPKPNRSIKKRTILVVEDDPFVVEVLKSCLLQQGYKVIVAEDGVDGLKMYKRYYKNLVLVISDVTMSNMNGLEMSTVIRKGDPVTPIILVSGDVEVTREEALDLLPEPRPILLRKPFSLKDLISTVKSCAPIDEVSVGGPQVSS